MLSLLTRLCVSATPQCEGWKGAVDSGMPEVREYFTKEKAKDLWIILDRDYLKKVNGFSINLTYDPEHFYSEAEQTELFGKGSIFNSVEPAGFFENF